MKIDTRKFEQDGVTYDLYDLPKGFVIKGDVDLREWGLSELPDLSEVTVKGIFSCAKNSLTSLKGAPKEVGKSFYCGDNKLTSLEGAPRKVGGDFYCSHNQLTSLYGISEMSWRSEVGCDAYLAEKYGVEIKYRFDNGYVWFQADELSQSTIFQKECGNKSQYNALKQRMANDAEKSETLEQKVATSTDIKRKASNEKVRTAFEAWLKQNGNERK